MGLGLAIVRKIMELHQASIHIKSEPGAGTIFWFQLPTTAWAGNAGTIRPIPEE
jgi:signal transduction histidine kinase